MRYVDFRDVIREELNQNPAGLTWAELKERLNLPYDRPCPSWVIRMEKEFGLSRARGSGRAYVWRVRPENETGGFYRAKIRTGKRAWLIEDVGSKTTYK